MENGTFPFPCEGRSTPDLVKGDKISFGHCNSLHKLVLVMYVISQSTAEVLQSSLGRDLTAVRCTHTWGAPYRQQLKLAPVQLHSIFLATCCASIQVLAEMCEEEPLRGLKKSAEEQA